MNPSPSDYAVRGLKVLAVFAGWVFVSALGGVVLSDTAYYFGLVADTREMEIHFSLAIFTIIGLAPILGFISYHFRLENLQKWVTNDE